MSALVGSVLLAVFVALSAVVVEADSLIENVALHKKCQMSSYHAQMNTSCGQAVNGDTRGMYPGHDNCIHTAVGDSRPWLEVDLGQSYPIVSIVLFARDTHERRMANFTITVDGKFCHRFPKDTEDLQREIYVSCTHPRSGRVVRIFKVVEGKAAGDQTLNLCELQVLSCVKEAWGSRCDEQCGQCEGGEGCDKVTGHCRSCAQGLQPPFCHLPSDQHLSDAGHKSVATYVVTGALAAAGLLVALP